jgi:glucose/arabinose dehydrogenase
MRQLSSFRLPRRRDLALTLLAFLTIGLVACGDDASSSPAADGGADARGDGPGGGDNGPPPKVTRIERALPQLSFTRPVDIQYAGDGKAVFYVVEQAGQIKRVDLQAQSQTTFLDIRGRVDDGGNEEGLLGLAFHPSYAQNGQLFVNYTDSQGNVIARFDKKSGADEADPGSEAKLLPIPQPQSNHNGGGLIFGADGMLYGGIGDGGGGNDTGNNAQNRQNLLGTIFRIDVDNPGAGKAYGIPSDNPFVGAGGGVREEIWAYGLRNPWRFAFDAQTGWMWIGDVGQNAWEEVSLAKSGGLNFGWRIMEGEVCRPGGSPNCDKQGLEPPVWVYPQQGSSSITGGRVYRGKAVPALVGWYVYADAVTGEVWRLKLDAEGKNPQNVLIADTDHFIVGFGVDHEGELYYADLGGKLYRFVAP